MRDFGKVITAIYEAIPHDAQPFRSKVLALMRDGTYVAPEQDYPLWIALSALVNHYMPPPHRKITDWQRKVIDIFTGKEGPKDENASAT